MTPRECKQLFESDDFQKTMTYRGNDLGIFYTKEKTSFKLWAPTAEKVSLELYKSGDSTLQDAIESRDLTLLEHGVWNTIISGDLNGVYFTYKVTVAGKTMETIDPYAYACGVNGKRGMILDLAETNPEGWEKDLEFQPESNQPVIYELHVKDFSYDLNGGFLPEHRGKYLAFTDKNTCLKSDLSLPCGVEYIKQLGVNYVHLLPVFDFASVDEAGQQDQFNWGYDPLNFNIPEGSYATDATHGEVRIREFKEMVKALHQAGIGVIMDVVYNHTYELDSCFQRTVPYYYYRQNEDGTFSNGSACGNETASERIMFRNYMVQSVLYWAREYHIDGFRFDLMGLHDVTTMNLIRKELNQLSKPILMYGEPWKAGESPMARGEIPAIKHNLHLLDAGISIFCDNTRDTIKGSVFDGKAPGFVNGDLSFIHDLKNSIQAWCNGGHDFTPKAASQIITYVSAHDNYTLWDKLMLTTYRKPDYSSKKDKILAMNKLIAGIIFTSKGIPFFQAGEEFGRTKEGEENSYNKSAEINMLSWNRRKENSDLVNYYKGLIHLQKQLLGSHSKEIDFIFEKKGILVYRIQTSQGKTIWVGLNGNTTSRKIKQDTTSIKLLADAEKVYFPEVKEFNKRKIKIKGKSIVIWMNE